VNANVQKPQITMTRTNLAKPMEVTGVEHVEITTDETTTEE
jgi:4-hydroxyphenylpyruvate dioxygenase-like putative hemolysin